MVKRNLKFILLAIIMGLFIGNTAMADVTLNVTSFDSLYVSYPGYSGVPITWSASETITYVTCMAVKEYNINASYAISDTTYCQYLMVNNEVLPYNIDNVNGTSGSMTVKGAKYTDESFYLRLCFFGDSRKCICQVSSCLWSEWLC